MINHSQKKIDFSFRIVKAKFWKDMLGKIFFVFVSDFNRAVQSDEDGAVSGNWSVATTNMG